MSTTPPLRYKRLLLKLSGEALMGKGQYGIDISVTNRLAADIAAGLRAGAQIGVVVGGGNIFRGLAGAAAAFVLRSALVFERRLLACGKRPVQLPFVAGRADRGNL